MSWGFSGAASANGTTPTNGPGAPKRPGLALGDLRSVQTLQSPPNPDPSGRPALTVSVSAPGLLDLMGFQPRIGRRSHSFEGAGKLQISPDRTFEFTADDLTDQGEIGRGGFGAVYKMHHARSGTTMAVKRIRSTVEEKEQGRLLMDLDVVMRSSNCPYIVQFYGALFREGDCWICMELMAVSLDRFYKFAHRTLHEGMPEAILGKMTVATLRALSYLKDNLQIIHRDVKPSNILLDRAGNIKLCDFGISGQLVDSIAKTRDAGCQPYMAPERIDPKNCHRGYDVRSDVWSLGITLVEVSTGRFPYPRWESVFDQLTHVVEGPAPTLDADDGRFSTDFINFVNTCLIKDYMIRPKFDKLLRMAFVGENERRNVDVASYVVHVLEQMPGDLTCLDGDAF